MQMLTKLESSEGMELSTDRSSCPFCGQDLSGSTLLTHYQVYFSEAYATHKSRIADTKSSVLEKLGGDRLARFQRKIQLSEPPRVFRRLF